MDSIVKASSQRSHQRYDEACRIMAGVGNEVPIVEVCPFALAKLYGSPFEALVWSDMLAPVKASEIDEARSMGETLAPSAELMGCDIRTRENHIRRIAWLADNPKHLDPVDIVLFENAETDHPDVQVLDGHHRLVAALYASRRLGVGIQYATLNAAYRFTAYCSGRWLSPAPQSDPFGDGVFPLADAGGGVHIAFDASLEPKIWVSDAESGAVLARFGKRLWQVWDPSELAGSDAVAQEINNGSDDHHKASFIDACCHHIGGPNPAFRHYLEGIFEVRNG